MPNASSTNTFWDSILQHHPFLIEFLAAETSNFTQFFNTIKDYSTHDSTARIKQKIRTAITKSVTICNDSILKLHDLNEKVKKHLTINGENVAEFQRFVLIEYGGTLDTLFKLALLLLPLDTDDADSGLKFNYLFSIYDIFCLYRQSAFGTNVYDAIKTYSQALNDVEPFPASACDEPAPFKDERAQNREFEAATSEAIPCVASHASLSTKPKTIMDGTSKTVLSKNFTFILRLRKLMHSLKCSRICSYVKESFPLFFLDEVEPTVGEQLYSYSTDRYEGGRALKFEYQNTLTSLSFLMKVIRCIQLLVEMHHARKYGWKKSMKICLKIEIFKLILKFALYLLSPFAIRVEESTLNNELLKHWDFNEWPHDAKVTLHICRRTKRVLPGFELPKKPNVNVELSSHSLTLVNPRGKVSALFFFVFKIFTKIFRRIAYTFQNKKRLFFGEGLHHLRPVIELIAALTMKRSNLLSCWIIALTCDTVSIILLSHISATKHLTVFDKAELLRRRNALALYLLRPPFFQRFLLPYFELLNQIIKCIPILNLTSLPEAILSFHDFYFFSSGT